MTTNPFYAQQPTVFTGLNQGSATGPASDGLGTPTTSSPAGIGLGLANGLSMMGPVGFFTTLMAHPQTPFDFFMDTFGLSNAPSGMPDLGPTADVSLGVEGADVEGAATAEAANSGAPGVEAPVGSDGLSDGPGIGDGGGADGGSSSGGDGWAMGGHVTGDRLMGFNPKGPDDGFGALDEGEYVLRAAAAKRLGPAVLKKLNSGKVSGKDLAKALMK